jgi:hypothetical protein
MFDNQGLVRFSIKSLQTSPFLGHMCNMKSKSILIVAAGLVLAGLILNGYSFKKASVTTATPFGAVTLVAHDATGISKDVSLVADASGGTSAGTSAISLFADDSSGTSKDASLLAVSVISSR